jgi:hypothetical protein
MESAILGQDRWQIKHFATAAAALLVRIHSPSRDA